jgi:hypothetical protein
MHTLQEGLAMDDNEGFNDAPAYYTQDTRKVARRSCTISRGVVEKSGAISARGFRDTMRWDLRNVQIGLASLILFRTHTPAAVDIEQAALFIQRAIDKCSRKNWGR